MRKVLVANRGEIASRIISTCKEMGMETVAVYSDADKDLPFVGQADKAYRIGEAPVNKSYLNMEEILRIAIEEKVWGIHPGYGLLSENALFAQKAAELGIVFIGPHFKTLEKMGDKIQSRKAMNEAGVPVVPGSEEGISSLAEAKGFAETIGYPVMLKASGGGGGIGMIRCENEQTLTQNFQSTKTRAKAYFGNEEVFIEKCIENGRHIEVQIFADQHGNVVHLFERNCSIQRRNQKVIEESPSPCLSATTREKMFDAAVKAAHAVDYLNAGTIEFLVDEAENFYFLEMNTRLQVEHPVTEMITGLNLVKWQLLVAMNEPLPQPSQQAIMEQGHAMEFRVYAEDPRTFMPSPGKIVNIKWGEMDGIRIDAGYRSGNTVTPFYDPLVAKCIVFANTREGCLDKAKEFFRSTSIEGIKTNLPLFQEVLQEEAFTDGNYTTSWLMSHKNQ
ncbi:acetyl-CoA carboxylase biotin carboxylase subunit [Bacillus sp. 2205SS5-2]|uniref:acetyl-CoA carboxylase biotin carboxylase subunit n=1 Tax=Bacillus sp. 2205SS5-2 TaxID=3109031 RepID=UPI0030041295